MNQSEKPELESTAAEQDEAVPETTDDQMEPAIQEEVTGVAGEGSSSVEPSRTPLIIALVALVTTLVGVALGYMKWMELNDSLQQERQAAVELRSEQQESRGRLDEIGKAIAALQTAFVAQGEILKQERARLESQRLEMKESLDGVFQLIGRSSTEWIVAEVEYLMRIANRRLHLEADAATALVALEAADTRLRDTGDPVWNGVRERLAAEMTELKTIKLLDMVGNASRLSGLISQVEQLKLPQSGPVVSASSKGESAEKKDFTMDTVLRDGWEGFKSLMVIRKNDRPLTAMLGPEQRFFLYQNLRLQLESARMALLRRDQSLYDSSLQRATAWVGEFFDPDEASTKAMQSGISELKRLKVAPKLPDISGSLHMLWQQQRQISEARKAGS